MKKPQAKFDLSFYTSLESVAGDMGHWKLVLEILRDKEMPPKEAKKFPGGDLRGRVIGRIERLHRLEAQRAAGDPGPVLARRLSNAEYNYTIHDLTGVDIRPPRDKHFFNGGFTFLLNNDLQLDAFAGLGLNRNAEDNFIGTGLARRF